MIDKHLEVKYWNGTATPEENVMLIELMNNEEMWSVYKKIINSLSTNSVFDIGDARGRANALLDSWNWIHDTRGWYDIFEDEGSNNPYPIRYVSKEKYEAFKASYN